MALSLILAARFELFPDCYDGPLAGKCALLSSTLSMSPIPHLNIQMRPLHLKVKQRHKVAVWAPSEE